MNRKAKLTLIVLLSVALFAGAYALYGSLAEQVGGAQLAVEPNMAVEQGSSGKEAAETTAAADKPAAEAPAEEAAAEEAAAGEAPAAEEEAVQLHRAPDFTVYTAEGEPVKLSDYFGKPIVLNFWASWCTACAYEKPAFQAAYEQNSDVQFLMVNLTDGSRETMQSAQNFLEEGGYSFPVLYDMDYDAAITYAVNSLPTSYFLDAEGNMVAWRAGMLDPETLEIGMDMIR